MNKAENSTYFIRNNILYKSCPSCSTGCNKTIYYPCPEFFGYRNKNYIQSSCSRCRGIKNNPLTPFPNATTKKVTDILIPSIRVLPMSKEIFLSYDKCISFLSVEMPRRGNTYFYKKRNLVVDSNSLILFQYNSSIVAYAYFDNSFDLLDTDTARKEEGYNGYYVFKKNSVTILSTPVTSDIMSEEFNVKLSQVSWNIPINYLPRVFELLELNNEDIYISPDDISNKNMTLIDRFSITGIHQVNPNNTKSNNDYIEAQKNKTAVGDAGEKLILEYEKKKLITLGLTKFANKVKIVSEDNTLGYDVLSFDKDGNEMHIEVKSKSGNINYFDFYISENELSKFKNNPNHFIYFLSHLKSKTPFLFILSGDMLTNENIKPVLYRVLLDYKIDD